MVATGAMLFARVRSRGLCLSLVCRLASRILGPGHGPTSANPLILTMALLVASLPGLRAGSLWTLPGHAIINDTGNLVKRAGLVPLAAAAELAPPKAGRVVAIDPGHGGTEIGAQHNFPDGTVLLEKDLNLKVALKVADLLTKAGYRPVLTRTSDKQVNDPPVLVTGRYPIGLGDDLQARVDIANNAKAELFLSIHFNANRDSSMHGSEVYYSEDRPFTADSRRFAQLIQQNLVNGLAGIGYQEVGVVKMDMSALGPGEHFYVLGPQSDIIVRPSEMPAALAEGLFLSNDDDATMLRDEHTLDVIALAYAKAIHQYFAGNSSELPTSPPAPEPVQQPAKQAAPPPEPVIGRGTISTAQGVGALFRAAPNTAGDVVGALPEGATVDLLQSVDGEAVIPSKARWYRAWYDGSEGYVYAALVQGGPDASSTPSTGAPNSAGKGTVKTQMGTGALLRAEPDTASKIVRAVPEGEVVDLLQSVDGEAVVAGDGRWYRAQYGGNEGYVYAKLVLNTSGGGSVASADSANSVGKGTVKTQMGTGALLRAKPDTASKVVRAVPEGEVVDLLQSVDGEAVVAGDALWYRARYGSDEGYVYAKLLSHG